MDARSPCYTPAQAMAWLRELGDLTTITAVGPAVAEMPGWMPPHAEAFYVATARPGDPTRYFTARFPHAPVGCNNIVVRNGPHAGLFIRD
jgi:hypothetical protein